MQRLMPNYLQLIEKENLYRYLTSQTENANAVCSSTSQAPLMEGDLLLDFWRAFPGADRYLSQIEGSSVEEAFRCWLESDYRILEVEAIWLRNWQHERLPSVIFKFPRLEWLHIHSPHLTKIPSDVFHMAGLKKLTLNIPLLSDNESNRLHHLKTLVVNGVTLRDA